VPTAEHERVVAVLHELVPTWESREIGAPVRLPGGYANDNYSFDYRGAGYVLRIVRDGLPGAIPRAHEQELLTTSLTPLAPAVVAYRLPEGHLLTRRIDAPLLADAHASVAEVAHYLATLHRRLPPTRLRYDVGGLVSRWLALAGHAPDARVRLARLDTLPQIDDASPCHNDLNPWNVVAVGKPDEWRTLDWEWFGSSSRWLDAIALSRGLSLDADAEAELIARYCRALEIPAPSPSRLAADALRYWLREWAWAIGATALWGPRAEFAEQIARSDSALSELGA